MCECNQDMCIHTHAWSIWQQSTTQGQRTKDTWTKWQTLRWTKDKEWNLITIVHYLSLKEKQKRPRSGDPFCKTLRKCRREFKGRHERVNKTESLWEANLPLRGSPRGRFSDFFWGLWRFQRFLEVFGGCQRFSEVFTVCFDVFRVFWEVLSETLSEADFPLRSSQSCCPLIVLPRDFL